MGEKASMWNLWHGCHKLSEGCRHCYVYRTDGKYGKDSSVVTKTEKFDLPLQRKKNGTYKIPSGNLVYTCFTSDFLIEDADEWRAEAWEMMRIRQDLRFLFITKRIDRLQQCLPPDWGDGYDNVTICCTMENQETEMRRSARAGPPFVVKSSVKVASSPFSVWGSAVSVPSASSSISA